MADAVFNSKLAEYYMTIRIGDYVRPKPFADAKTTYTKTIILPLPMELRDDTAVNYNNQDLKTVGDVINGAYKEGAASYALSKSGSALSGLGAAAGGAVTGGAIEGGAAAGSARSMLGNKFGEMVSGGIADAFPPEQIASAIQQGMGMAPNPNPTVAFAGPQLREFSYSWTLMPKSLGESNALKQIIQILKTSALPQNVMQGAASVLKYPKMCQVNFYPWDNSPDKSEWGWSDKSIIKHKKCFMGAVNVSYTPSNVPAFFYENQNPVAVQLTVSFKEIEYFMSHDWGGDSLRGKGDFSTVAGAFGSFAGDQISQIAEAAGGTAESLISSVFGSASEDPTQATL